MPSYRLEVVSGSDTDGGGQGIAQGLLDVAAMTRPPRDNNEERAVEYMEFGLAGQAIITHPDISISNLTHEQVVAIFSGEIVNWSEVGGPDMPVVLYVCDEGDPSMQVFRSSMMGETPFADSVARVLNSQDEMLEAVATTPGSIGIAAWPPALARGSDVRALNIDGVTPSDPNYLMTDPLGIGFMPERAVEVWPLLTWLSSDRGREVLSHYDVIDVFQ